MRRNGGGWTTKSDDCSLLSPICRLRCCCSGANVCRPRQPLYGVPSNEPVPALDPELDVAASAMVAERARFVVIGGFAVVANRYVRATEDIDFLVPDDLENDRRVLRALTKLDGVQLATEMPLIAEHLIGRAHLRARTDAGLVDIIRGGLPPLDFETVESRSMLVDYGEVQFHIAGLSSIVAFKRLADRPRDRNDLAELKKIHGDLPIEPIAGLDDQ